MRPHLVVVLSPLLDPDLRVHAVPKPLEAQELVAELPVERFVGGILPRLPRVDQRRVNARVTEPAQDGGGHELRSVVLQFVLSLVAWGVVAKWTFAPGLTHMVPATALFWLALPHTFRHIGMVFVVPGVVAHELPEAFAIPAAYGDLTTGVLALVAVLLRAQWSGAIGLVWLFNIVGALDLANALRHVDVVSGFGSVWYIPTMLVPLLLVTHVMMFMRLVRGAGEGGWYERAR